MLEAASTFQSVHCGSCFSYGYTSLGRSYKRYHGGTKLKSASPIPTRKYLDNAKDDGSSSTSALACLVYGPPLDR